MNWPVQAEIKIFIYGEQSKVNQNCRVMSKQKDHNEEHQYHDCHRLCHQQHCNQQRKFLLHTDSYLIVLEYSWIVRSSSSVHVKSRSEWVIILLLSVHNFDFLVQLRDRRSQWPNIQVGKLQRNKPTAIKPTGKCWKLKLFWTSAYYHHHHHNEMVVKVATSRTGCSF